VNQPLSIERDVFERTERTFRIVFDDFKMKIHGNMTIQDVEGWDSLVQTQLVRSIEKEFNLRFSLEELKSLQTVGQLLTLIEKRLQG
jgi:acyl carrier protein